MGAAQSFFHADFILGEEHAQLALRGAHCVHCEWLSLRVHCPVAMSNKGCLPLAPQRMGPSLSMESLTLKTNKPINKLSWHVSLRRLILMLTLFDFEELFCTYFISYYVHFFPY